MKNECVSLVRLKGPDRVRKRPAVMFGSDGVEGLVSVIKTLFDVFVSEAALGFSSGIDVNVHKDNSISVRSYDRGFILDETIVDGKPVWHYDFCELYAAPRELDDSYYLGLDVKHNELYGKCGIPEPKYQIESYVGLDLCCVQYVSEFMNVESTRDGIKKTLEFKKGYSVSGLQKEHSAESANTFIHFKIDGEVFSDVNIPFSEIVAFLQCAAATVPGLKCNVSDERDGTSYSFLYPNGVEDYVRGTASSVLTPLFINEIEATGRDRYNHPDYDAKVKIVFAFVKDAANVVCLHNYRQLEHGGHHLDIVKERLMHYINWEFVWDFEDENSSLDENNYSSRRRFELSFDDIKNNIVLLIETNCTKYASVYTNEKKSAIKNRMITDMAHDLVFGDFQYYLKQNHQDIFDILKEVKRVNDDK